MFYTYILYSELIDRYYIGYTENLELRLERHNQGWSQYTKQGIPWNIVYFEKYEDKSAAIKREREIKNKKSRRFIEKLIAEGRPE
jgi:putative endonuclease